MGYKTPPKEQLFQIVMQHPDLTYSQIKEKYGWTMKTATLRKAARAAGVPPRKPPVRLNGGGPLDVGVMSHEEFWGRVDRQFEKWEQELREGQSFYKSPLGGNFKGIETTARYVGAAD